MHRWLLFVSMLGYVPLTAISIVYNFRIAQITRQPITDETHDKNNTLIGLLFDQFQKKHTDTSQNFPGGLASFIYHFDANFFRTDFAVSHIKERTDGSTTFSGTQTDDLLFTLGHNFKINKRNTVTLSGFLGIPTHKVTTLEHVSFGYGQLGTGIQIDGSYTLHHDNANALLYGARYLYFVPRTARDIECKHHTFSIGNVADVLFAYKDWWGKHGLELGFTERINFGAHCSPHFDEIIQRTNYVRSNFYAVYKYKFLIRDLPNRFLFNIAYGFDEKSKKFGNKYIITLWTSWSVNF
ncbi:MAG: hypothetical protein ACHQVS_02880 [Candidatus Babeliales bacterium]